MVNGYKRKCKIGGYMKKIVIPISLFIASFISAESIDISDINQFTLDEYLNSRYGVTLLAEGYVTEFQKIQFLNQLKLYPNVRSIAEIGLNAGHSAEMFFKNCENLKDFVSFDINQHAYTKHAVEYFSKKYQDRFTFIDGDSLATIPRYAKNFPQKKFDLIYIDGGHQFKVIFNDIKNCKALAHRDTVVWIDDFFYPDIQKAVEKCVRMGIIEVKSIHPSLDRKWVEARYLFPNGKS